MTNEIPNSGKTSQKIRYSDDRRVFPGNIGVIYDENLVTFDKIVLASGLSQAEDFVGRDLRDLDFSDADLRGFNFSHSDLRGTMIRKAKSIDKTTAFRGAHLDDDDDIWIQKQSSYNDSGIPDIKMAKMEPGSPDRDGPGQSEGQILQRNGAAWNERRGSKRNRGPFGVLDIGTTKIVCAIGQFDETDRLVVLGLGWQKARGVLGGGIVDIEEAERAIRTAVGQAEEKAGIRLAEVTVNLSCGQPESRLFNVRWPIDGRSVTEADIRRVLLEGRTLAQSPGRSIIHILPMSFSVDGVQGVVDPRGLHCKDLVSRLNVVDADTNALRTLDSSIARCDLEMGDLVSAPMAAGIATLVEDEKLLGATVLDMGGGTTGMAVFAENHLLHTEQLPLGGLHVTRDIASVLSTTVTAAERLKTLWGSALVSPNDEREMLPVPLVGEDEHQIAKVPRSMIVNVIRPRLEETFELVRQRLDASGLGRVAGHRVVLTGGASQLTGVREMAAGMLNRQVRLGRPAPLRGLPDSAQGPAFATAVGLLSWSAGEGRRLPDLDLESEPPRGLISRIVAFLRERV